MRARLGAFTLHAHADARVTTAPARAAFRAKFESEVDPENALEPNERARRAEAARRAFYTRLALTSARSRRMKKADRNGERPVRTGRLAEIREEADRAQPTASVRS